MDRSQEGRILGSDMTVSDKIRALARAGYPRAEIARVLGKRYQHVRNVLEADKLNESPGSSPVGVAETGPAFEGQLTPSPQTPDVEPRGRGAFRLLVRDDGSVVLPQEVREAFGIEGRGVVMARLEGDEFRLNTVAAGLRRAQEMLRPYMREGVSWVDELIAERRREAERE